MFILYPTHNANQNTNILCNNNCNNRLITFLNISYAYCKSKEISKLKEFLITDICSYPTFYIKKLTIFDA